VRQKERLGCNESETCSEEYKEKVGDSIMITDPRKWNAINTYSIQVLSRDRGMISWLGTLPSVESSS
jgi:hypothetical protein